MNLELDRRRFLKASLATTFAVSASGLLVACGDDEEGGGGGSEGGGDLTPLAVMMPFPIILNFIADCAGVSCGFFEEAGLDVDLQFARTSSQAIQQMAAGSADVIRTAPIAIAGAVANEGAPFISIGMPVQEIVYVLVSAPDDPYETVDSLVGATVGLPQLGEQRRGQPRPGPAFGRSGSRVRRPGGGRCGVDCVRPGRGGPGRRHLRHQGVGQGHGAGRHGARRRRHQRGQPAAGGGPGDHHRDPRRQGRSAPALPLGAGGVDASPQRPGHLHRAGPRHPRGLGPAPARRPRGCGADHGDHRRHVVQRGRREPAAQPSGGLGGRAWPTSPS